MNNVTEQPSAELYALLNENGVDIPVTTIVSDVFGVSLDVVRLYGVEVTLPEGGVGRLIVRKVEQSADQYTARLTESDERSRMFYNTRMSGILAEAQVSRISHQGFFVGRRVRVEMQGTRSSAVLHGFRHFGLGRLASHGGLLDFNITGIAGARQLELSEMDYTEPTRLQMISAAIRHGNRP